MSLRVTGLRDMDGQNPVERPERVEALLEVAQKFAGSDFSLGCFMSFSNFKLCQLLNFKN